MLKFKKLLVASSAIAALVFSASICASADAQIDSLSRVDNTIYAKVSAENARLYAVARDEGLLSDVFFKDIGDDGNVELPVGEASEYALYLWDKESLAPISAPYKLVDNKAYAEGNDVPVPEYEFSMDENAYTFNQEDDVMIVSAIDENQIKGFKAGVEVTYSLVDEVVVVGLSDKIEDVVPGSVVLIGTNKQGDCAAVELLASLGLPINEELFKSGYGVYTPSDGSTRYENVVNIVYSKSGGKITVGTSNNKKTYLAQSNSLKCYRVGLAMDGDTPVISCSERLISGTGENAPIKSTSEYSNYIFLRIDTEQSKTSGSVTYEGLITQCVVYSVPKNFDPGKGDGEYSDIFNLEPIVIIE